MKRTILLGLVSLLILGMMSMGCGPSARKSESIMDNPQYHWNQGMKLLQRGDYSGAENSFNNAISLNPKYARAYGGLALVQAQKKDFKGALDLLYKAVNLEHKDPWLYIARGRVLTMQHKGDNWIEKADRDFKRAEDLNADKGELYYWWGVAKKNAYDFDEASNYFSRTIAFKDEWSGSADKEYAIVQKILRAAPGTKLGKKIALINRITRAEVAVLFMEELKLTEVLRLNQPKRQSTGFLPPSESTGTDGDLQSQPSPPADIKGHWAQSWIEEVLRLGIMEVGPDNLFHPDEEITRAEYALFIQNILISVQHDGSLATKYLGETSRFSDVRAGTAVYNAIALAVDRGVMKANINGEFDPMAPVDGADALLIIRSFQNSLRMTF